jgi:hypothetical protein
MSQLRRGLIAAAVYILCILAATLYTFQLSEPPVGTVATLTRLLPLQIVLIAICTARGRLARLRLCQTALACAGLAAAVSRGHGGDGGEPCPLSACRGLCRSGPACLAAGDLARCLEPARLCQPDRRRAAWLCSDRRADTGGDFGLALAGYPAQRLGAAINYRRNSCWNRFCANASLRSAFCWSDSAVST